MLPDRPLNFVDADGVPFIELKITSRGNGHPPQQFIYQPALEQVLRDGVDRFPNVDGPAGHECLRVLTTGRRCRADARRSEHRRRSGGSGPPM